MSDAEPAVLQADANSPAAGVVGQAAAALATGKLVVFPTDTVYGIACRADDEAAVRRLFAAKRRPLTKALPLLVPEAEALEQVAAEISATARGLAERFWPGPLTMVVRKAPGVSDLVTAGQPTVGVRVPDMALTRAILRACPFPVAVTSANLSDEDPACRVAELPAALVANVALLIDAGPCPGLVPSTVVDVTTEAVRVLRQGPIKV